MNEQEIIEPVKNALAVVEIKEPTQVFVPNGLDPLISGIRERALKRLGELDISTPKNRKAIISLSVEVRDAKVFVESKRVALVEAEKKRLKLIDAEGSRVWDELEALQKEVRKPVTDWEQAEEKRVKDHEEAIAYIVSMRTFDTVVSSPETIAERIHTLNNDYAVRKWEEFYAPAHKEIAETHKYLTEAHTRRTKEIADAAELQRLRDEQAARDKKEREHKIAAACNASTIGTRNSTSAIESLKKKTAI